MTVSTTAKLRASLLDAIGSSPAIATVVAETGSIVVVCGQSATPPAIEATDAAGLVDRVEACVAAEHDAAISLRVITGPGTSVMHGWRLSGDRAVKLDASTVRWAHTTDASSGVPLPPEPGVTFA